MKYLSALKKIVLIFSISLISFVGISTSLSCEDPCKTLALADLTIPVIADVFDYLGNPIIDPVTGQRIQALNEIFYNQSTGEYFNSENPPTQGLYVGDVIQMATSVYNVFSENKCDAGATAMPTDTQARLNVSGSPDPQLNGVFPLNSMPTPTIPYNSNAFTATAFNLATPGFYSVNMTANENRTISEHNYDNNFYVGDQGNYSRGNAFIFYVKDRKDGRNSTNSPKYRKDDIAPKTIEELNDLEIYRFIKSEAYTQWIIQNYNN